MSDYTPPKFCKGCDCPTSLCVCPPPIPAPEGEVPPRVTVDVAVDGDFQRYLTMEPAKQLYDYFGDPMHGKTRPPLTYVPEAALSAEKQRGLRAVEEARAKAFEDILAELAANENALKNRPGGTLRFIRIFIANEKQEAEASRAAKEPS